MQNLKSNSLEGMNARWLRWSLTGIAVLLGMIAIELSVLLGPMVPRAEAQSPPDSGVQLNNLITAQHETNRILQQILDHLRTGEIKVALPGTDKGNSGTSAPARRPVKATPKVQAAPKAQ